MKARTALPTIEVSVYCIYILHIIYIHFMTILSIDFTGEANVTLKDAIFQASTPVRHAVELLAMNSSKGNTNDAFVFAFTDGGPDHNISFLNVLKSLLGFIFWANAISSSSPVHHPHKVALTLQSDLCMSLILR